MPFGIREGMGFGWGYGADPQNMQIFPNSRNKCPVQKLLNSTGRKL